MGARYLHNAGLRDVVLSVRLVIVALISALLFAMTIGSTLPFQPALRLELQLQDALFALCDAMSSDIVEDPVAMHAVAALATCGCRP